MLKPHLGDPNPNTLQVQCFTSLLILVAWSRLGPTIIINKALTFACTVTEPEDPNTPSAVGTVSHRQAEGTYHTRPFWLKHSAKMGRTLRPPKILLLTYTILMQGHAGPQNDESIHVSLVQAGITDSRVLAHMDPADIVAICSLSRSIKLDDGLSTMLESAKVVTGSVPKVRGQTDDRKGS